MRYPIRPIRRYHSKAKKLVYYNSINNTVHFQFRNSSLTTTLNASWPLADYNDPERRKEIASKVRIFRKAFRD